jgi:hypothetical protein
MAIRFCQHKNYDGICQDFDVGSYTKPAISGSGKIGNDAISSVKILKPGFYVRAFKDNNYMGTEKNFNTDIGDLKSVGFGDAISSFIVVDGNPPPLAALPPVVVTPPPATNVPAAAAPVPADTSAGTDSTPSTDGTTPMTPVADSGSSMWIWVVVMILFLVLAAVGGGAYFLLRKKPAPVQQPQF